MRRALLRGEIRGFLHLYIGEEAVATGVLSRLGPTDSVVSTYREHGHALARGISMTAVMAELLGRVDGCSGGRGGSMHLFDAATRFYGGNAIVASALPVATGLALADQMAGSDAVTVCFFGEGAVAEGEFHESMNLAALWNLPVLFCCENNLYAMGTALDRSESQVDIASEGRQLPDAGMGGRRHGRPGGAPGRRQSGRVHPRGRWSGVPRAAHLPVPGALDVRPGALPRPRRGRVVEGARSDRCAGPGPHRRRDPGRATVAEIDQQVAAQVEEAVAAARASGIEPVEDLTRHVYAERAGAPEVWRP